MRVNYALVWWQEWRLQWLSVLCLNWFIVNVWNKFELFGKSLAELRVNWMDGNEWSNESNRMWGIVVSQQSNDLPLIKLFLAIGHRFRPNILVSALDYE